MVVKEGMQYHIIAPSGKKNRGHFCRESLCTRSDTSSVEESAGAGELSADNTDDWRRCAFYRADLRAGPPRMVV